MQTERPSTLYSRSSQALWYDDEKNIIYAFGGDNPVAEQFPPPISDNLQGFIPDDNGGGVWTEVLGVVGRKGPFPSNMHATSAGKFTIDDKNAYLLGGFTSERTSPSSSTPVSEAFHNPGFLTFNFENTTLTNSSSSGLPFESGVLLNAPVYGSDGVLLYFDGGNKDLNLGFNNIGIFDKMERKWFFQTADEEIPRPRDLFCAVGVQEKNQNSFEM